MRDDIRSLAPPLLPQKSSPSAADLGAHNLFDENTASVNDETFMSTINFGASFSRDYLSQSNAQQDEDFEVDEDGEGLIEALGGRTANFTADEDRLLCHTWLNTSLGGTDQTQNNYWTRMKEYFDKYNTSGNERTDRSLWSHWSVINADCQKWVGVMAVVDRMNPSGTNAKDRVSCFA
uniref:Uncharacterized protein n=1 Tax=Avena sativa TaxID=4498 RepID=A0ACD5Z5M2_AVESA